MAQRRPTSTVNNTVNAHRQRAASTRDARDTRRAGHIRVRAVISRWHRRPEGRPPSEGRQAGRDGAALARVETATAAMTFLASTDAVIFDMRQTAAEIGHTLLERDVPIKSLRAG
jgi:hypothetical protein